MEEKKDIGTHTSDDNATGSTSAENSTQFSENRPDVTEEKKAVTESELESESNASKNEITDNDVSESTSDELSNSEEEQKTETNLTDSGKADNESNDTSTEEEVVSGEEVVMENEEKILPSDDEVVSESEEDVKSLENADDTAATDDENNDVVDELAAFKALVDEVKDIAQSNDWQNGSYFINEKKDTWKELDPVAGEAFVWLEEELKKAEELYYERRSAYYESQKEKRQKNLDRKRELLARLEKLVEEKKWTHSRDLSQIEKRWESIRQIPNEFAEELNEKYTNLRSVFEKNRVANLIEQTNQESLNLDGKLLVRDKFKAFIEGITEESENDWKILDEKYEEFQKQWRKIGRVSKEKNFEINNEFNDLRDSYYNLKYDLNKAYKKQLDKNEAKLRKLIEQAKNLMESDDLAEAARDINRLHKEWKDAGSVIKKLSDELWSEFKAASDTFNEYKNEHIDDLKNQEQVNYELKEALVKKAEKLTESTDWKKTGREIQELLDEWKSIGPVPRRKGKKIWQQFKHTIDHFYANKRHHFKEIREQEKANLILKREIIEKAKLLIDLDDPNEAVNKLKNLQTEFNAVGFVPLKHKDKVYKQFKEVCDTVYGRARNQDRSNIPSDVSRTLNFEAKKVIQSKYNTINKLRKKAEQLKDQILNYSDTKTFIKPNKKGIKLIEELDDKIVSLQAELDKMNEEIDFLRNEIDTLSN